MTVARQQALVHEWSARATSWSAKRLAHRAAIHDWKQQHFGNPGALAWAFAAGVWWRAGRDRDPRRAKATRKYVGLANTIVLAWRLLRTVS